jgi:gamma-glutamyl-gamma-aminobutyrate hydrolase PuuD
MCRGIQMFNVALGGTLVQDLSLVAAAHPSDPGWSHSCRGCGGSGSSCIKAS